MLSTKTLVDSCLLVLSLIWRVIMIHVLIKSLISTDMPVVFFSFVLFRLLAVFLFKHANTKQFGRKGEGEEEDGQDAEESLVTRYRMAMLSSWLPLLCHASNGTDAPVLSSGERAEMVKVLEEMIEKLSCEQQEEVLALWLHHFTSCSHSDWPNLQACYTRWYSKSRDLLLERLD